MASGRKVKVKQRTAGRSGGSDKAPKRNPQALIAHRAFAPLLGAWGALLGGLAIMVMPNALIETATRSTLLATLDVPVQATLAPLAAKAPFLQVRELSRRVHTDACIELDTNRYSVPWRLIGERVAVTVAARVVLRRSAIDLLAAGA